MYVRHGTANAAVKSVAEKRSRLTTNDSIAGASNDAGSTPLRCRTGSYTLLASAAPLDE